MIPQGAPATWFSANWHSRANSVPSGAAPDRWATACIVATSSAADELTPLASGTCEWIRMRRPFVKRAPRSRANTRSGPTT